MSTITRYQTERQFVTSGDAVRLKQLGNQGPEFMHECFQALGLGDEPWDMLAFRDPYRRLGVPRCRHREFLDHVDQNPFSAAMHQNNFYAVQFHPEKSALAGELVLKSFLRV